MIFRARRYDFLPIYLRFFQIFFGRPEKTGKQPENSYLCTDGNTVRQYPHPPSDRTRHRTRERRDTSVGGCRRRSCDRAGACRPGTDRRRDRPRLPASRPRGATADFRRAAATGRGGRKTRRTALREGIRGDDAAAQTVPPAGRHLPRVHRFARTGRTSRRRRLLPLLRSPLAAFAAHRTGTREHPDAAAFPRNRRRSSRSTQRRPDCWICRSTGSKRRFTTTTCIFSPERWNDGWNEPGCCWATKNSDGCAVRTYWWWDWAAWGPTPPR